MIEPPILSARDVRRTYRVGKGVFASGRELRALDGVSLTLKRGDVLGIVGESGCGKSTLGRILLGLDRPTSGEVHLEGKSIATLRRTSVARRIQPIFQDPYSSLNSKKRIGDIIGLPLTVHRIGSVAERRARVEQMIEAVGLGARHLTHLPEQLSGGQRQRVAIARALIMRPEVVVCDEPTSALDVSVQSQILNLLQYLQREFHLSYILISHNLAVIEHIATRVAVMYLGQVVEEGATREIFRNPKHPYTQALLRAALPPIPAVQLPEPLAGTFPSAIDPPPGCPFHPRCPHTMTQCRSERPALLDIQSAWVRCHLYRQGEMHVPRTAAAQ